MAHSVVGNILWRVILLPFAALPLFFTGAGVYTMVQQHRAITHYQPVPAVVTFSELHVSRGKTTSYRPDVHYRYDVNGRSYVSRQVTPIQMSGGREWSERILARYPAGSTTTSYYDPANPDDAILVRQYDFLPYFFLLFSMPFVYLFTFAVGGAALTSWKPKEPLPVGRRYQLHPHQTLRRQWQFGLAAMGLWYAVGLFGLTHYWNTARPADSTFAAFTFVIYFLLGLIPLKGTLRARKLSKRTDTPRVTLDADTLHPGQSLEIEIEQRFEEPAPERLRVGLTCQYSTRRNKRTITETLHERVEPLPDVPRSRTTYRTKARLKIPPDAVPSQNGATSYQWRLSLFTDYPDGLTYEARFPLTIKR